jgi:glycosyltransferase involved in cell wall biosynthesis
MLLREGKVCEDCVGKVPWRGAVRGCYRQSVASSTVLAGMLTLHRAAGTWSRKVTRYIALNDFCRRKFIEAGLPQERILVKANFVRDAAPPEGGPRRGLLFVGRLSPEKGVQTLSDALAVLPPQCLRAAGTGPQADLLAQAAGDAGMLGALDAASVRREMGSAIALVLPSIWYENFPRTLVEAFSCGLPVIASRIGALAELVQDGVTGLLVEPSSASDLAAKMRWALEHPEAMREMGNRARAVYEAQYTEARNHEQLMAIYREAMDAMRAG